MVMVFVGKLYNLFRSIDLSLINDVFLFIIFISLLYKYIFNISVFIIYNVVVNMRNIVSSVIVSFIDNENISFDARDVT